MTRRIIAVAAFSLVLTACAISPVVAASAGEFFAEDARIAGREMHSFRADGEQVEVVLGDFSMTLGRRKFSGRDAVIWIRQETVGRQVRRTFEIYIEGNAEVVEPGGTVTRDLSMLVTARHRGDLRAEVAVHSDRSMLDLPLYRRALAVRKAARDAGEPTPSPGPSEQVGPEALPTTTTARSPGQVDAAEPPEGQPLQPVTFRAESVTSQEDQGRRVTVCKGNVYISYGNPDSRLFMEMRSQAAVLFSAPPPATQESPGPAISQLGAEAVGELPTREQIEAVYLEGDVVLSRGERFVRGTQLFYDFRTDRAIILDMVLRSVQEQRNIPLYVRAEEARQLSRRELWFRDAKVSTSEMYTPSYHIGAGRGYMMDTTPYDEKGEALDEPSYFMRMENTTFNIRGVPVAWWPWTQADGQTGDSPIKGAQAGQQAGFGFGVETEWFLFRLLGLVQPEGFKGTFDFDVYERGVAAGVDLEYARDTFAGYLLAYGVNDQEREDDFGRERKNVSAPEWRGRVLMRHQQFLPEDWLLQFELSYISDENFLEEFFRTEFWAGKEQDTLLYAKKQRDNWAFTSLVQGQINHFQTGPEAYPDLGLHLIAQPLGEVASLFSETHLGAVRWRVGDGSGSSEVFGRADQRLEVDVPLHFGSVNVTPYAMARPTWWSDAIDGSEEGRLYGALGLRSNSSFWKVFESAESRLFDIHRIKHTVTPEINLFAAASNVDPDEVFPISPGIEQHMQAFQGASFGVRQRWQTYRGHPEARRQVDLLRFNVIASFFNDTPGGEPPSDGRWLWDRPEYSLARNAVNGDLVWNISDATAFLADANYDVDDGSLGILNAGVAVQRNPRLRYYLGARHTRDLGSTVGTVGFAYVINRKYQVNVFEQYDFEYDGGVNLATRVTIVRKFPRWYTALTFMIDRTESSDFGVVFSIWPEGVPEFHIGGSRSRVDPTAVSDRN